MKKIIIENSVNYTAVVVNLPKPTIIPGFDNLVMVTVFGNDILISKDYSEGLYLYFNAGTELSDDFRRFNNLNRESALNSNPEAKGYFKRSYVEAIKIRGIVSTGFIMPITSLSYISDSLELEDGDEFNSIEFDSNRYDICSKYVREVKTRKQGIPKQDKLYNKLQEYIIPGHFKFHTSTEHLTKNIYALKEDSNITITNKVHGSSVILSHTLVKRNLSPFKRFLLYMRYPITDKEYGFIWSSGKPRSGLPKGLRSPSNEWGNKNSGYYDLDIWHRAYQDYKDKIDKGITIYGELVGYTRSGSFIQSQYDYGCVPGEYRMLVYRITYTTPEGIIYEFSWDMIKQYCNTHRLEHVEEFYHGPVNSLITTEGDWRERFLTYLRNGYNLEQNCKDCLHNVPAEGIALRINDKPFSVYKLKSKLFILGEMQDIDNTTNIVEDEL